MSMQIKKPRINYGSDPHGAGFPPGLPTAKVPLPELLEELEWEPLRLLLERCAVGDLWGGAPLCFSLALRHMCAMQGRP